MSTELTYALIVSVLGRGKFEKYVNMKYFDHNRVDYKVKESTEAEYYANKKYFKTKYSPKG